jgi:uncharacterized membrane protein
MTRSRAAQPYLRSIFRKRENDMNNERDKLRKLIMTALMTALTCVLTLAVRIPSPTKGYMNLGDSAVLLGGWLLGPVYGTAAGAAGSALADLFAGYTLYVPATAVIKAAMALIVSAVPRLLAGSGKGRMRAGFVVSAVIAEAVMTAGYYLYEAAIIGEGFAAALAGVSGNVVQGAVGAAGSYFLIELLGHTGVLKEYGLPGFNK